MTETLKAPPSSKHTRVTAQAAILLAVSYQMLLLLLIRLRPDLDPSWHTISEWAIGPHAWLMRLAFIVSGATYAALAFTLWREMIGVKGAVARTLLALCVLGAIGVGVFTTDPMPLRSPLTTRGTLHVLCGGMQLALFPFAALFSSLALADRSGPWSAMRRLNLASAWLPLAGFASFAAYSAVAVFPLGPNAYGPGVHIGWPPRIAFLTYGVWVVLTANYALRAGDRRQLRGSGRLQTTSMAGNVNTLSA